MPTGSTKSLAGKKEIESVLTPKTQTMGLTYPFPEPDPAHELTPTPGPLKPRAHPSLLPAGAAQGSRPEMCPFT